MTTALINWTQNYWLTSIIFLFSFAKKLVVNFFFRSRLSKVTSRSSVDDKDDNDSTDDEETEDSKSMFLSLALIIVIVIFFGSTVKRLEFEKRRKLHYNEFEAVLEARKLMEKEDEDDDDDKTTVMEVDEQPRQSTSSGSSVNAGISVTSSDTHV